MPIFFALGTLAVVVFLGWLARRLKVLSSEHTRGMSSYIYYFALPALFFSKLAQTDLTTIDPKLVAGSLAPIFALLALLMLLRAIKVFSKENFALLALTIVFGSNAFFGITFFEALAGETGLDFAVITSSILGPVGIFLTIYIFEYATNHGKGWCFCGKIFRNPLILSILAGVIFSLLNIRFEPLLDGVALIGQTAGPLAIFALGTFLYENLSFKEFKNSVWFALFRLLALPVVTFLILNFWLLPEGNLREFLFLQSGIPAAVSLAVFAKRYNFHVETVANFVVITSLGSFLILGIAYFLVN
ncbi:MAG: AEC family transporter [Candidatus Peribacteraceae bacterium]|nr:AEC family transporter [Candidatus Peribacteraceae bacterium]